MPQYDWVGSFGNTCTRVTDSVGGITGSYGFVIEPPVLPDPVAPIARQTAPADLPDDALIFLPGNRYGKSNRPTTTVS